MASSTTPHRRSRDLLFTLIVIVVWAAAFGVYLVNRPDASLWGLSSAYAYSLLWWLVAIAVIVLYAVIDMRMVGG
ncbi:MAG: hypothetical protein QW740_03165 [Sulfolobales archaeon]